MAQIYGLVRLLPANHPYLNAQNIGGFGLKHVVAEAANHLVLSRKNIDQLIIFTALLAGIVIFALQFIFLVYTMFIAPAMAQTGVSAPNTGISLFRTAEPTFDIAHIMLDRVFGVPDIFNSCVNQGIACVQNGPEFDTIPWPIHDALHGLFQFYSSGLLVIGLLIFLYFIIVVVAETATTGTPFGQRFQNVWVPIRLVMAIGLLVPIQHGLNSAQYIVLHAAKIGSGFATNGWLIFNEKTNEAASNYASDPFGDRAIEAGNPTGESSETLIGYPATPDISAIFQAMSLIHTCGYTEWVEQNQIVFRNTSDQNTRLRGSAGFVGIDMAHMHEKFKGVKPYFVKNLALKGNTETYQLVTFDTTFEDALAFSNNGSIRIVFGEWDDTRKAPYPGNVKPTCGEMRVPVTSFPEKDQSGKYIGPAGTTEIYYNLVQKLWFGTNENTPAHNPLFQFAARHAGLYFVRNLDGGSIACSIGCRPEDLLPSCTATDSRGRQKCLSEAADSTWRDSQLDMTRNQVRGSLRKNYNDYLQSLTMNEDQDEVLKRGWGGAGMWYNHIAELNGSYVTATQALPELRKFPMTMEDVRKAKNKVDEAVSPQKQFDPSFIRDIGTANKAQIDSYQAETLNAAYTFWEESSGNVDSSGNMFEDTMNLIFGVEALFQMRTENAQLHPLAQLSLIGKGMVETTIRNIMLSSGLGLTSGVVGAFFGGLPELGMKTLSGFLFSTAFLGLTAGLVLYYVLPFMPFLYFFFAVSNWVKEIFEAMVGAPLWALAHIRIDGEGLPGDAASSGYMLILAIMIRPIAIVFGLIAAILIFGAQVRVLNIIWDLVVQNVAGHSADEGTVNIIGDYVTLKRDIIDQFFFTIIYTVIVYMLANASFKLIDNIPNDLMRWMSSGVTSFGDMTQTPAQNLQQYVATGGLVQGQELAGAVNTASSGLGGQLGRVFSSGTGGKQ